MGSQEEEDHRLPPERQGAAIPAKHACLESVIEECSTNIVVILNLFMVWFLKDVEVEQEKSEPGPNSIRLSKDKPFYFHSPRTQESHSSG